MFYHPDISCGFATFDADESRHIVRVLRHVVGDLLEVTDGRGGLYRCRVVDTDLKGCLVRAESRIESPRRTTRLHLAVAPTKNPSRMEWMMEKAVEVGVDEITLIDCAHSERSFLKTDRLQRVAVSAMKQSLHTTLPVLRAALPFDDWLREMCSQPASLPTNRLIAHCEAGLPRTPIAQALRPQADTVVLIGPEGDFAESEIAQALDHGFQPVSLGPSRLRTETAALYAACAFSLLNDIAPNQQ